ncbi:MAG: hypothetical protein ACT4N8_13915 [Sphingosinicella sp.]|uniref:hypothetical protein n=1 Tax=Sphingosinicella sp. TaxID=1917971 RepID=UPI0040383965
MIIIFAALLTGKTVLADIDRNALDLAARAEALQPRATAPAQARRPAPARRTAPRRASGGGLDLSQITTICRAAGNQNDPTSFLTRISTAYSLSAGDSQSLRSSCAAYLAGRADARRTGGTY